MRFYEVTFNYESSENGWDSGRNSSRLCGKKFWRFFRKLFLVLYTGEGTLFFEFKVLKDYLTYFF